MQARLGPLGHVVLGLLGPVAWGIIVLFLKAAHVLVDRILLRPRGPAETAQRAEKIRDRERRVLLLLFVSLTRQRGRLPDGSLSEFAIPLGGETGPIQRRGGLSNWHCCIERRCDRQAVGLSAALLRCCRAGQLGALLRCLPAGRA